MKWLNGCGIRVVLVGFVAAVLAGDAARVYGDFTFGKPVNLGPNINSSSVEIDPSISADGLELFFESRRPGGYGKADIYVSRRASKDDPWGPCMNIGAQVNTAYWNQAPSISADGLSLYFSIWSGGSGNAPGGYGEDDLWVTTRRTKDDPWEKPVNLGATVNSSADDWAPSISADELVLFFASGRSGGLGGDDLWFTSRATKSDPWGSPVNLGAAVNSSLEECFPDISADGRMLFFSDHMLGPWRPGGYGGQDIWVTTRATVSDPWGIPMNLGPVINTSDWEFSPNISADGSTLYFSSGPPVGGGYNCDLWQAPVIPIVDFNGDEVVDIKDLVILIEHWGTNETLCDIGPMPWGDGKVDEKDLEVLMRYWQQEVLPVSLIAYWKLDEAEGIVAADKAGTNNATLVGNPIWQPAGGKLGGALQLDGINDYVSAPFVVDPAKSPFSVFAWVKGGGPGQVIVSQADGANWLMAADPDGALMTDLKVQNRKPKALTSAVVITDGDWHRVGLSWDGSNRILYVDDVEVAKDTQANLPSSTGGLYLGAGSTMTPSAFWSGLIDDVRIYDRPVKP